MTTPPITCPVCGQSYKAQSANVTYHTCSGQPITTAGESKGTRTIDEVCGKPPGTFHAMREAGRLTEEASLDAALSPSPASTPLSSAQTGTNEPQSGLLKELAPSAETQHVEPVARDDSPASAEREEIQRYDLIGCEGDGADIIPDKKGKVVLFSDHQLARAQDKARIARLTSLVEDAFNEAWRSAYKTGLRAGHPLAGRCDDKKEREQDWTDSDAAAELNRNTEN